MLMPLLKFELRYHFRQVSFLITAFVFFTLGALAAAKGGFGGPDIHRNAPYVINNIVALLSLFSIFAGTLFSANVVLRDPLYQMESIVYSTSIRSSTYFLVRFLGLLTAVGILLVFSLFGIAIATLCLDSSELGPFKLSYFLMPLFTFGLPNAFFAASFLFATAMLTKNVRAIYTTGVLLYILYMVAGVLGNSPLLATSAKLTNPGALPFLIDPFGLASFFYDTRQWPAALRNTLTFPITGVFLANRMLWMVFSLLLLLISYRFFSFRLSGPKNAKTKKIQQEAKTVTIPLKPVVTVATGFRYQLDCMLSQLKIEVLSLFKHVPFAVMLLLWTFLFAMELKDSLIGQYHINFYATTGYLVQELQSIKFALVLIIFYAAELIGREKATNFQLLVYSTPVRNSSMYLAKFLTLVVLLVTLITINIGIGIGVQLMNGFGVIDWQTYLSLYYYSGFPILLFIVLILFVQNLAPNKYVGMLCSMLVVFLALFANRIGLSHYLFRFAATPTLQFSYFNSFGNYANSFNWYMLYWLGFAVMLMVASIAWWQKGNLVPLVKRINTARFGWKSKLILLGALLVFMGSGSFIYHQTNILGGYESKASKLQKSIAYEKQFKAVSYVQPIIKKVSTRVDLFPDKNQYVVHGQYILKNESGQPITKLWVNFNETVNNFSVHVPNGKNEEADTYFNHQFITLAKPLQSGEEMLFDFSFQVIRNGFVTFDSENSVSSNGSYIELEKFVPSFGYDEDKILTDPYIRKQNGLSALRIQHYTDFNLHLVDLEAVISVPEDQQAVTVGMLEKSWTAQHRRYFRYKTSAPINFSFAISAANYKLKTEVVDGILLNLYTLPGPVFNTATVMQALKDALSYGNENFGRYQAHQLTLAEIPQYKGAATAYPGLLFSAEGITFLADYEKPDAIDQSYAITTHEVAHQWWANQLVPSRGAGYAMLTESLAKYTEYILLEKRYGKMALRKFLEQEQDLYFLDHQSEQHELPLVQTMNQNYVHYQKGGLAFYAIKEMIGEQELNTVLKQFISAHRKTMSAARPQDLVVSLLKAVPIALRPTVEDLFTKVVTYDLAVELLQVKSIAGNKYQVDLNVKVERYLQKERAGTDFELNVDLACFGQSKMDWKKPLYLKKQLINKGNNHITMVLAERPKTVAVDPYRYILDANSEDNMKEIK